MQLQKKNFIDSCTFVQIIRLFKRNLTVKLTNTICFMGFEVFWRSILIKLLHFKLITLAIYLEEEVNIWNELAVCGDVGPLQSNTDSSAVILSSASASVFMWLTMQKQGDWLQI